MRVILFVFFGGSCFELLTCQMREQLMNRLQVAATQDDGPFPLPTLPALFVKMVLHTVLTPEQIPSRMGKMCEEYTADCQLLRH